jgi:hypothetical protein
MRRTVVSGGEVLRSAERGAPIVEGAIGAFGETGVADVAVSGCPRTSRSSVRAAKLEATCTPQQYAGAVTNVPAAGVAASWWPAGLGQQP